MEKSEPLMRADGFYENNVELVSFFMRAASTGGIFPMTFHSILFARTEDSIQNEMLEAPSFFVDVNLDQIIDTITADRQEYHLQPFFYTPLHDIDAIMYRHEVIRDLENITLLEHIQAFAQTMRKMRQRLAQAEKLYYTYQKERWFVDAVELYCEAVPRLVQNLSLVDVQSRGFLAFRAYVTDYANSSRFTALLAETKKLKADLATVKYCLLIKESQCAFPCPWLPASAGMLFRGCTMSVWLYSWNEELWATMEMLAGKIS